MKVLFCTNAFEKISNGPAKFAHLLLAETRNTDFEIRILTEDITYGSPLVYRLGLNIPNPVKLLGQFIRMWKYHRAAMKIRKEFAFDVLVYNHAIIGLLSYVFFKRTVGMINDYNNSSNSITAVLKRGKGLNKRVIFYYVEYLACHLSKCIIVNSEYLKKILQQNYHCKASLFKVLHKGIENKLVTCNRGAVLKKKIAGSVLFVKTDFVLGGLFTLIKALKNIDHNVALTIIGPAAAHHEMLKTLLNNANIAFELFDYMPPQKVYEKMEQSEIFCVPSRIEAFGVANLEAMALACKVVTTNVGGIPEALNGNSFAWLVEPENSVALKDGLTEAFNTSIQNDLDKITLHLEHFSSTTVVSKFRENLAACS